MPIYSPTGFLDITNATLRTSNTECQNLKIGTGDLYVTSEISPSYELNLSNVTSLGATSPHTLTLSNVTTAIDATSNIITSGNLKIGGLIYTKDWGIRAASGSNDLYVGRFTVHGITEVLITDQGASLGSASKYTITRNVNSTPLVNGIDSSSTINYEWYFKSHDSTTYDLWVRPSATVQTNIKVTSSTYIELESEPSSSGAIVCVNGLINMSGNVVASQNLTVNGNVAVDTDTLFVDSVNDRVGIGTTTPGSTLDVVGDATISSNLAVGTNKLFVDTVGGAVGIGSTLIDITDNTLSGAGNGLYIHNPVEGGHLLTLGTQRPWVFEQGLADASTKLCLRSLNSGKKFSIQSPDHSNVMTIVATDGGGAVGIGTADPVGVNGGRRLEGSSSTGFEYIATRDDTEVANNDFIGGYLIKGTDTSGTEPHYVGMSATANGTNSFFNLNFFSGRDNYENNTPQMTIDPDGNVGIGTTDPGAKLTIGPTASLLFADNRSASNARNWAIRVNNSNEGDFQIGYTGGNTGGLPNFYATPGDAKVTISKDGNVGIGTNSPYAKLHVVGNAGSISSGTHYGFQYNNAVQSYTGVHNGISIYADDDIVAGNWVLSHAGTMGSSDERIKKEIVDVEDGEALSTIRLLKPKRYKYRDDVKRGIEPVWGFIAQEVADTIPYATQKRTECIPNIYETANVSTSNVITFTNFNTTNLESKTTSRLKLYDTKNTEHVVKITGILGEHSIQVEEDLTDWVGSFDESNTEGNEIFVYGEEVNDFHFLKKDAIFTVATAALQEVDRQQQADKVRIAELESQLASVLTRLDALENA